MERQVKSVLSFSGTSKRSKVIFIINPVSGVRSRSFEAFSRKLRSIVDTGIYDLDFRMTEAPGHGRKICREELEKGTGIFVAVGGDGTLNEVASQLVGRDAVLGIIPAGSGNGLANHLGIPRDVSASAALLNKGKTMRIDTCMVNDTFFVSIAGLGFDARVARQFARASSRGFMTYARIALREYFSYRPHEYKLEVDGRAMDVSAFFISFANSNQFGYNTRIAPGASLTDGKIDLCIVKKPPVRAIPGIARLVIGRKADRSKYMETLKVKEVRVWRERGKRVNVDGESKKLGKHLHVRIIPDSLKVIIP